jgi:predicted chitinase
MMNNSSTNGISQSTSSAGISSSSAPFVSVCIREYVGGYEFKTVPNSILLASYQENNYSQLGGPFSSGDKIVISGGDCNDAVALKNPDDGEIWNLRLLNPWQGSAQTNATFDIITWSKEGDGNSTSSSSTSNPSPIAGAVGGWFTQALYNKVVPTRNSFYSWASFVTAYEKVAAIRGLNADKFLGEGSTDQRKKEAAAFFANIAKETGRGSATSGLHHIKETCAPCSGSYSGPSSYGTPKSGKYYYGRGPFQLTWASNYGWFSKVYFGSGQELLDDPDLVHKDAVIAWSAAIWYWHKVDSWVARANSLHDIMVNNGNYNGVSGFGGTIKSINGAIECSQANNSYAVARGNYYKQLQSLLGVSNIDNENLSCASGW